MLSLVYICTPAFCFSCWISLNLNSSLIVLYLKIINCFAMFFFLVLTVKTDSQVGQKPVAAKKTF